MIAPHHPKANGETEIFMKLLNKTEQIAHSQGRESQDAIYDVLMGSDQLNTRQQVSVHTMH